MFPSSETNPIYSICTQKIMHYFHLNKCCNMMNIKSLQQNSDIRNTFLMGSDSEKS